MTITRQLLTIALAAVAVTTASLATSEASAHWKGGKRFFFASDPYFYSAAPIYPVCWKWTNGKQV
jgi:hypothetical protein